MLVSDEPGVAEPPTICYNVIKHLAKNSMEQHPEVTPAVLREAFSTECKKANVLIQIVQSGDQDDKEGMVKVAKLKTVIPAGQTKEVKCTVRTGPVQLIRSSFLNPKRSKSGQRG